MNIIKNEMFSSELLEEIRSKFMYADWDPFSGKRIYLEASGGGLRLKSVVDTIAKEMAIPDELFRFNPASDHVVKTYNQGIEDVKTFLGVKSGVIVPANSATHVLFRAVNAITNHIPGTNVVTTQLEHPASSSSVKYYADVTGKEFRVVGVNKKISKVDIESVLAYIDENTNLLLLQHASNQTGAVNDVKKIIEEARKIKPDLYTIIDAVQYGPHGPIDVEDVNADAYVFGPYKAYCVKGIAFGHFSDRLANLPHENLIMKPDTNWILGSPSHAMVATWSRVVDYLEWLGAKFTDSTDRRDRVVASKFAINSHMVALLDRILNGSDKVEGLMQMDHVNVCGVEEELEKRMCILLFQIDGQNSDESIAAYNQEYGVRLASRVPDAYSKWTLDGLGWDNGVRLSAGHYNTPEEIDVFLKATKAMKK